MKHNGYNNQINGTDHPYGFQEQEEQNELGLNWIQFKWRNHNPEIGRFMSLDPLAEKYNWMTPYQFASNQPIHGKEIEGLENENDLNLKKDKASQNANITNEKVSEMQNYVTGNHDKVKAFRRRGGVDKDFDNCIQCHNKAAKIALGDNNLPTNDNSIQDSRSALQESGNAGETITVGFKDAKGNKAITTSQAVTMDGSIASVVSNESNGLENSVFGVSIADGHHSMTITVKNSNHPPAIDSSLEGSPVSGQTFSSTYTLSDQNSGNLQYSNGQALDQRLTFWVSQRAGNDVKAHKFPAQVQVHQLKRNE